MSHFSTLVIIDAEDAEDSMEQALWTLEEMLEPYKETRFNPISKWDYWILGNSYTGQLLCKDNAIKQGFAKLGKENLRNEDATFASNQVDICRFDMLDLPAMREKNFSKSGFDVYAFIDYEYWHERGRVGWLGTSTHEMSAEEWEAILKQHVERIQSNDWIAIVDCHI